MSAGIVHLEFADLAAIAAELLDAGPHDLLGVLDVEAALDALAQAARAQDAAEYAGLLFHSLVATVALAHHGFGLAVVTCVEACRRNGFDVNLDPELTRKHVHEVAVGDASPEATVYFVASRMRAPKGDVIEVWPPPRQTIDTSYDDLVRLYLEDIGRHPVLTREQETELAAKIEAGKNPAATADEATAGEDAERALVMSNLRLVVAIARKYESSGMPLLDLIQEGNLGLMYAVEHYDWRKGFKFSTYATWWIRQAITRALANRQVRPPVVEVHPDIEQVLAGLPEDDRRILILRLGLDKAEPRSLDDVAARLAITVDDVKRVEQRVSRRIGGSGGSGGSGGPNDGG